MHTARASTADALTETATRHETTRTPHGAMAMPLAVMGMARSPEGECRPAAATHMVVALVAELHLAADNL